MGVDNEWNDLPEYDGTGASDAPKDSNFYIPRRCPSNRHIEDLFRTRCARRRTARIVLSSSPEDLLIGEARLRTRPCVLPIVAI